MAIAYLGNRGSTTGTSPVGGVVTIQPTHEVVAGDLLVLMVAALAGAVPRNINDTQGNVWEVDQTVLNTARVSVCSSVLANELTPADTITLNVGVSLLYCLDLEEFSGIDLYDGLGGVDEATGAGTALTAGSQIGFGTQLTIIAWAINAAEASFTPAAPLTGFGIVSQIGLALLAAYEIGAAPSSPSGTAGTTGTWAGANVLYSSGPAQAEIAGPPPLLTR